VADQEKRKPQVSLTQLLALQRALNEDIGLKAKVPNEKERVFTTIRAIRHKLSGIENELGWAPWELPSGVLSDSVKEETVDALFHVLSLLDDIFDSDKDLWDTFLWKYKIVKARQQYVSGQAKIPKYEDGVNAHARNRFDRCKSASVG